MALLLRWVDGVTGSDTNSGETETTAWKTLDKVAASLGVSNDFVVGIKPGVYWLTAPATRAGAYDTSLALIGFGNVVIKTPTNVQLTLEAGTLQCSNIVFLNDYPVFKTGASSSYTCNGVVLRNCVVKSRLIEVTFMSGAVASNSNFAFNVTTPSGVTLPSGTGVDPSNSVFFNATSAAYFITTARCNATSGTTAPGGGIINPSGFFPTLTGAYPILPKRFASNESIRVYPSITSSATVLTTTVSTNSGTNACDPRLPSFLIDGAGGIGEWSLARTLRDFTANAASLTRFNVDMGEAIVADSVFCANSKAAATGSHIKDVILQGSNSASAFSSTTYADDTGWTTLGSGTFASSTNNYVPEWQTFPVTNSTAYRYYSFKLVNVQTTGNAQVNKLLIGAKNTFSHCDQDFSIIGNSATLFFYPSANGWYNDSTFTSGSATVGLNGIVIGSGTTARVCGPVMEYFSPITLNNIAMSATEASSPTNVTMEYRLSDTLFYPSSTSPIWTSYTRNSSVSVQGKYLQYRMTLVA